MPALYTSLLILARNWESCHTLVLLSCLDFFSPRIICSLDIDVQRCSSTVFVVLIDLFLGSSFTNQTSFQTSFTSAVGAALISIFAKFLVESLWIGVKLFVLFEELLVFLIPTDSLCFGDDNLL